MFDFFRKRRIKKYAEEAMTCVQQKYIIPVQSTEKKQDESDRTSSSSSEIRFSVSCTRPADDENEIRYSLKEKPSEDHYNALAVSRVLRNYSDAGNYIEMLKILEQNVNQTFVDRLLYYINEKGVRDSEVYKAAQVDKRLFSKMVSNREYKPSKDTAIALALALELSLDQANDMLSRAGYTFSHSNKRDIIIEFFFREKVYNLIDANDVLHRLNQKLIGRF